MPLSQSCLIQQATEGSTVHPVALALNPKAIFLTPPFLPASAQSACQPVGFTFQNVEASLL